jgi:hypothetical protein
MSQIAIVQNANALIMTQPGEIKKRHVDTAISNTSGYLKNSAEKKEESKALYDVYLQDVDAITATMKTQEQLMKKDDYERYHADLEGALLKAKRFDAGGRIILMTRDLAAAASAVLEHEGFYAVEHDKLEETARARGRVVQPAAVV